MPTTPRTDTPDQQADEQQDSRPRQRRWSVNALAEPARRILVTGSKVDDRALEGLRRTGRFDLEFRLSKRAARSRRECLEHFDRSHEPGLHAAFFRTSAVAKALPYKQGRHLVSEIDQSYEAMVKYWRAAAAPDSSGFVTDLLDSLNDKVNRDIGIEVHGVKAAGLGVLSVVRMILFGAQRRAFRRATGFKNTWMVGAARTVREELDNLDPDDRERRRTREEELTWIYGNAILADASAVGAEIVFHGLGEGDLASQLVGIFDDLARRGRGGQRDRDAAGDTGIRRYDHTYKGVDQKPPPVSTPLIDRLLSGEARFHDWTHVSFSASHRGDDRPVGGAGSSRLGRAR